MAESTKARRESAELSGSGGIRGREEERGAQRPSHARGLEQQGHILECWVGGGATGEGLSGDSAWEADEEGRSGQGQDGGRGLKTEQIGEGELVIRLDGTVIVEEGWMRHPGCGDQGAGRGPGPVEYGGRRIGAGPNGKAPTRRVGVREGDHDGLSGMVGRRRVETAKSGGGAEGPDGLAGGTVIIDGLEH